ncbi:hypothetical protein RF11_07987 [Thelohanellus kitauei]|uniref:Uncharacterized protein n=1 Tax=Thelohanellus kitauei TaxID=669202 RepID=A0A0C2MVS3_THEKT|nr:hypothetical protein RF11_07987 [Thelohanellus kitauei]
MNRRMPRNTTLVKPTNQSSFLPLKVDLIKHLALGALRELRHRQVLNSRRGNKRSVNEKDESSMLPLDSSNSFERAIQTDIEELNNPTASQETKRSDVPTAPQETHRSNLPTAPGSDSKSTRDSLSPPPQFSTPTKSDTTTPPASVTPTGAPDYFTIHFIEQQHYLAAIERERLRYLCTLTKKENCSALPDHASYVDTSFPKSEPSPAAMQQPSQVETLQSSPIDMLQPSQLPLTKPSPYAITVPPPGNVPHDPESLIHNETSTCTPWSGWGACSDFCSNGVQLRYRECYNELAVKAADKEFRACSNSECLCINMNYN